MSPDPAKEDSPPAAPADVGAEEPTPVTFSPEEEAALVRESNAKKSEANTLFTSGDYPSALTKYDEALSVCPPHLDYELALLRCNVAACQLKLEEWGDAVKSAGAALEGLGRLVSRDAEEEKEEKEEAEEVEEEIVSKGASLAAPAPEEEDERGKRRREWERIKAKALMRRARARCELGGWQNLTGAEEDYKTLEGMDNLGAADRKMVSRQLRELPPKTKAAQEKEMAEMWGKLKDMGNGILRPFGLSTENFQMKKDEQTGGYSMSFNQGGSDSGAQR